MENHRELNKLQADYVRKLASIDRLEMDREIRFNRILDSIGFQLLVFFLTTAWGMGLGHNVLSRATVCSSTKSLCWYVRVFEHQKLLEQKTPEN